MAKWVFQPQHTGAEFSVRHMMVSQVRGHFKNINGTLEFDPANPGKAAVAVKIDASTVWTGVPDLDAHLRHADFLDVEHHPEIVFNSRKVELEGENDYLVVGDLSIRGVAREATLHVRYLGQWQTPWWENGVNKGPKTRAGFLATTRINRQDFGVSWNDTMDRGGVVVSDHVDITIDVEAILQPS
jgi:polyisoprenoid-binding protein YceI